MHVLLTGATGFVGFHTVMALLKAGHTVRLGVRNEKKMRELYSRYGLEQLEFALGELIAKGAQIAISYPAAILGPDDQKLRDEPGIEYRPVEQSLAETIKWLAEAGHIKPRWAKQLPPSVLSPQT